MNSQKAFSFQNFNTQFTVHSMNSCNAHSSHSQVLLTISSDIKNTQIMGVILYNQVM